MPPSLGSERATVQDPFLGYAVSIGWKYLPPEEALTLRRGETGTLLYPVIERKLADLNPGLVTPENVGGIVSTIENVRHDIEGNAEVLAWLRGERSIPDEKERRRRNVTVIDFARPDENIFHVTDEWSFTNGINRWDKKTNRPDVIFLVNGIPVALVETKSARRTDGIDEGVKQIRRYHRETPEMLAAPQVFNVTHLLDFHYGVTWNLERKAIFNWKEEEPGNFERKVKRFFGRERFLRLLGDWILFYKRDDELRKIVLRQHQTRAVDRVVERALDSEKRRGLVWHTQGAGKTFTMIKSAARLLGLPGEERPTVLMLVDREELEGQLFREISAVGLPAVVAKSKEHLRELLRSDTRGLIVSMIHKFDRADANLCGRSDVHVLVDEAHRTTGGDLGNYLVAAVPNATLIGFTGTPIDKTAYGQGTFKVFGKDDEKGYLDKYSIQESIEDGTTLPLSYVLAPNEMRVDSDLLEREFLSLAEAEGVSDIEDLNRILDRAIHLKAFLKSKDHVEKVARFAAEHFRASVEPLGYKAFLVGVDREACALYKRELDRHLPAEYSRVVYTAAHNDEPPISDFHLGEDEEKRVRKAFAKPGTDPKILIVTEKLLTGFDAPILYCMYLDKPMRDHTLLQAIARVNRPFETGEGARKSYGLVVDFVGIFEKIEKALAFDSDVVASVIQNIDVLKARFAAIMKDGAKEYLALFRGPIDDKAVERVIEAFVDVETRERFFKFFREVETLYEILSPDVFLRDHIGDYQRLAELHLIVRNKFRRRGTPIGDLAAKTEMLVRDSAVSTGIRGTDPAVLLDAEGIGLLTDSSSSGQSKVVNLGRLLAGAGEGEGEPYLFPISERAEAVLEALDERRIETKEALAEMERLLEEYKRARKEKERSGLDDGAFGTFWLLRMEEVSDPERVAAEVTAAAGKYPNHAYSAEEMRRLKAELYRILLPRVGKERMVSLAERVIRSLGS